MARQAQLAIAMLAAALVVAPAAEAVPPGAEVKVLVGSGETDRGSTWKVTAYRLDGRVEIELSIRTRLGRFWGGSPLEPQCGEIGWGSSYSDRKESVFAGPVSTEAAGVESTFIEKGGRRVPGLVGIARMSPEQAEKVGAEQPVDTFVASAPVDIRDFRRVEALALDPAGGYFPGYTWFARYEFHCGP